MPAPPPGSARPPPRYATRLVGREDAAATLAGARGVVAVVGPAGVGKTRLAAEALPGGVVGWVDGAGAATIDALARATLRDLGAPDEPPAGDLAAHATAVAAGRRLDGLVVDDVGLPGPGSGAATLLQVLADTVPVVIYTAPEPLGVPGERVIPLAPLPVDGPGAEAAIGVFLRACPRLGPAAADPHRDRAALLDIVRAAEGLPLALELAAARTTVSSLAEIAAHLRAEGPAPSALERSLRRSWDLLAPGVRAALVQLGALAGPFSLEAARAVVAGPEDPADALQVLVAWHLVRPGDGARFFLPAAVQAFVAAAGGGPDPGAVARHAAHYRARAAAQHRTADLEAMARDAAEYDAIGARASAPDAEPGLVAAGAEIAADVLRWESARRTPADLERHVRGWLAVAPEGRARRRLLAHLAQLRTAAGDPASDTLWREVLTAAVAGADPQVEGRAAVALASLLREEPDRPEAEGLVARGIAAARAAGDRELEAIALGVGARLAYEGGALPTAAAQIEGAVAAGTSLPPRARAAQHALRVAIGVAGGDVAAARAAVADLRDASALAPGRSTLRALLAEGAVALAIDGALHPATRDALAVAADGPPGDDAARAAVLVGLDDRLAGRGGDGARVAAASRGAPDRWRRHQAALVHVVTGAPLPEVPADAPPSVRGVWAVAALLSALRGGAAPDEVERALADAGPPSEDLRLAERVLRHELAARRREAAAWTVSADGATVTSPAGHVVALGTRTQLRRLVLALADERARGGPGLDVEALFEAGWPGERAVPAARANRVRVAVSTLRRAGVDAIGWERGRGWFFAAPVRRTA